MSIPDLTWSLIKFVNFYGDPAQLIIATKGEMPKVNVQLPGKKKGLYPKT